MSRSPRFRLLAATALAAASVTFAAGGSGAADGEPDVLVKDFSFSEATVKVVSGATVTWEVTQGIHTVTAVGTPAAFDSGDLNADDEARKRFVWVATEPGNYRYRCQRHPEMVGTVRVTEAPTTPPPEETTTTTTTAPPATTTTTAAPPATTTTTAATTTTTQPATGETAAPPLDTSATTTSTTQPPAAGSPAPTAAAGTKKKAGTSSTTTPAAAKGDGKKKDGGDDSTTTTEPAPAPAEGVTIASLSDGATDATDATAAPAPAAVDGGEQIPVAASADDGDRSRGSRAAGLLVATGIILAVLGLGSGGYAWYHRSSRYEPA